MQALAVLAAAIGAALWRWYAPWDPDSPFLTLIASRSPSGFAALFWAYAACWVVTPYCLVRSTATVVGLLFERCWPEGRARALPSFPVGTLRSWSLAKPTVAPSRARARDLPG